MTEYEIKRKIYTGNQLLSLAEIYSVFCQRFT